MKLEVKKKKKKCKIVYNVELSREIIQIIVWKLKIFKMRERGGGRGKGSGVLISRIVEMKV